MVEKVIDDARFNTYGVPRNKTKSTKKKSDKKETVPNTNYLWIGYFATALNDNGIQSTRTASWKCATRVEKGPTGCDAPLVPERELQNAVLRGINMVLSGRDNMMTKLKDNIEKVLLEEDMVTIGTIDAKLEELQQELIKRASARQDYEDVADEIDNLREQRLNATNEKAEREGFKMRIKEMQEFLENQTDRISEYDEQLVRKMIEKITIYDEKFVIEFKSGTSLDVRR